VRAPARPAQFEYKLGLVSPADYPTTVRMVQMAAAVKAETNGRLEIRVFPNSELGSDQAMIGQLRLGSIQLACFGTFESVVPVFQVPRIGFAFSSPKQALAAMDGPLGNYIRNEFTAKGMYAFEKSFNAGMLQVATSTKPVRTADDFAGIKLRTQPAPILIDLFRTLGASPINVALAETYTALSTHLVDAVTFQVYYVQAYRMFEMLKYLSFTNHAWNGETMAANADAWKALPPDIQTTLKQNAAKYTLLARNDSFQLEAAYTDKLKREGMAINTADSASIRARLGSYYARWKNEFGSTVWGLLEASAGRLG